MKTRSCKVTVIKCEGLGTEMTFWFEKPTDSDEGMAEMLHEFEEDDYIRCSLGALNNSAFVVGEVMYSNIHKDSKASPLNKIIIFRANLPEGYAHAYQLSQNNVWTGLEGELIIQEND